MDRGEDLVAVLGVTVEDQVARCPVVGERLAVVGEKSARSLPCVGISRAPGHQARDRAFGDLKTELPDLAVDARRTPRRVLGSHAAHEGADVVRCGRSSHAPTRCPAPGPPEALAMPADDGLGLDHRERLLLARPPATQRRPEESIERAESRSRVLPSEDGKLLAEREVLQDQDGPAGEDREENPGGGQSADEHPRAMIAAGTEGNRARPRAIRVSCTGTQLVEGQRGRVFGEGQWTPRSYQPDKLINDG